jgi:predicted transcriptional regulator
MTEEAKTKLSLAKRLPISAEYLVSRLKEGLSQAALARELGVSPAFVCQRIKECSNG